MNQKSWEAANWQQLQELFRLAEEAPTGSRTQVLREASEDPALVEYVLGLLAVRDESQQPRTSSSDEPAFQQRVGPYTLLRHLGTGGLGSVYLAEWIAGGAVMRCAVKMLSMHAAGPRFEARFEREQRILSALDHPNITRMLDAGLTQTGQPYLAMEYVDGVDIVSYCKEHKLSLTRRITLFLQVCDAVAHAHRRLTVHLDLKPSNVLVTPEGVVKLLDFGTSKLIEEDPAKTTTVFATPAYASPEQLRHEPITTACDVYAMGVMLFELLVDKRPYQDSSVVMLIDRAFRDQEPEFMSLAISEAASAELGVSQERLRVMLRGDLDTIVARCMHSRPQDRYVSIDALVEDVQRHLDGRPVLARRQTGWYRTLKFVRRNRVAVALTAAAALLVTASGGYGMWKQHQALLAAHRAEQMQMFMTRLFRLSQSGATGKPAATVGEMLQVGEHILPSFISNPADLRVARLSLAESMNDDDDHKDALPLLLEVAKEARQSRDVAVEAKADAIAGDIQYLFGASKEGDALTRRALDLSHDRSLSAADRTEVVALYVSNHDDVGDRSEESMDLLRAAIAESDREHAPENETASAINILGLGLQARGHIDEARQLFQRSLSIYQRTPYSTCDTAQTEKYLAFMADIQTDYPRALNLFQQSYQLEKQCAGDDDLGTLSAQAWFADELRKTGHAGDALLILEAALPRWRKAVGANSPHMRTPLQALSNAYLSEDKYEEAEVSAREEIRVQQGKISQKSVNMASAEQHLASALAGEGKNAQALLVAKAAAADDPRPVNQTPRDALLTRKIDELVQDLQEKMEGESAGRQMR